MATAATSEVFNVGIRCCISGAIGTTAGSLPACGGAEDAGSEPASGVVVSPMASRARLSSRMPSALRASSNDVMSSFTKVSAQLVADELCGLGSGPESFGPLPPSPRNMNFKQSPHPLHSSLAGGFTSMQAAKLVAADYFGGTPAPALMDDASSDVPSSQVSSMGDMMILSGSGRGHNNDAVNAFISEYRDEAPHSEEDALAAEVGHNANEYLEECFNYAEVSVLDREKFDAIPEIVKSDFTITGHLGKGCFSDVFEVVRKQQRQPLGAKRKNDPSSSGPNGRRRPPRGGRRASLAGGLSASVTTATLARPSHGEHQQVFALKCLRPQIRSDADQFTIGAEDLVHETAILANLDHRNIVKLYGRASGSLKDAFVLNDGYFILLERLGQTLHDRIEEWRLQRSADEVGDSVVVSASQLEAARSIADAVSYLHSKRIVFRDLKPDNVGFDSRGVLKLFDFGFAIGIPERDEENPSGLLYDRAGTPRYMAPEVALSAGYGLKADVYSFGLLLWEICALNKPFTSIKSAGEFERAVFIGGERPEVDARWPIAIRELVVGCWSGDPSMRPRRWRDVKSSLAEAMACVTGGGERKSPKTPKAVGSRLVRSMMARGSSSPETGWY